MHRIINLSLLICTCTVSICLGQRSTRQDEGRERLRVVAVPREIALPVIAYQPNCPLQFENIISVVSVEGGGTPSYEVRNRGTRPIRAFKTAVLTSSGNGWSRSFEAKTPAEWILPGQSERPLPPAAVEIVPLTPELREKLKLQGQMKGVLTFMVVSVEYADGTKYNDETAYKALQAYLEDLGARLNP